MEEPVAQQVKLDPQQVTVLSQRVAAADRELRQSIGRALAFVVPGLGHAFHGALFWALGYAAAFALALWRFWASLSTVELFRGPNELPAYVGWLALAVFIWFIQFLHVSMMDIND